VGCCEHGSECRYVYPPEHTTNFRAKYYLFAVSWSNLLLHVSSVIHSSSGLTIYVGIFLKHTLETEQTMTEYINNYLFARKFVVY
jgi:hypothetical protein